MSRSPLTTTTNAIGLDLPRFFKVETKISGHCIHIDTPCDGGVEVIVVVEEHKKNANFE